MTGEGIIKLGWIALPAKLDYTLRDLKCQSATILEIYHKKPPNVGEHEFGRLYSVIELWLFNF
jgi:hypothetical protein